MYQLKTFSPTYNYLFYRHRCFIVGWSQRSALRTLQGPSGCLLQARENPALPATPATTTAMTLPVCPAHLEPTPTAPTVNPLPPVLSYPNYCVVLRQVHPDRNRWDIPAYVRRKLRDCAKKQIL